MHYIELHYIALHVATSKLCCRQNYSPIPAVLQDVYKYCAYALVLQLGVFALYLTRARRHAQSVGMVFQRLVEVVIAAVPSQIPAVINLALLRCAVVLRQRNIHVRVSTAIKAAAAVEVAVFDKTGTLTGSIVSSWPNPHGMLPVLHTMCHAIDAMHSIAWQT